MMPFTCVCDAAHLLVLQKAVVWESASKGQQMWCSPSSKPQAADDVPDYLNLVVASEPEEQDSGYSGGGSLL